MLYGEPVDRPDSVDERDVALHVADVLVELGWDSVAIGVAPDLAAVDVVRGQAPTLVINLVDSLGGSDADGWRAAQALEQAGLSFTGATAEALRRTLSKLETRAGFMAHGIRAPEAWEPGVAPPPDRTVILKSELEHGSWGMDAASVLNGPGVADELRRREEQFGGRFYAEEYIEGREFNVALLETDTGVRVLPVSEIRFDGLSADAPRIVDYAAKWEAGSQAYGGTSRWFGLEAQEPERAAELGHIALAAWRAFGLRGYARVDFRVSRSGVPYALEVNANPCLSPDAGFAATAAQGGIPYPQLIAALAAGALASRRGA